MKEVHKFDGVDDPDGITIHTKTKRKGTNMSKLKEAPVKQEKTIKVKTLVIAIAVVIALIGSFVAGMTTANSYNDKIKADAQALAEVMSKANQ